MKLYPLDPLALVGALHGMSRPVDRHDFSGSIPESVGRARFKPGTIGRVVRALGLDPYKSLSMQMANVTLRDGTGSGQDTWNTNVVTTQQRHALGTLATSRDGRIFRYSSVGAVDTVVGSIYQSAVKVANHLANTPPVVLVGATSFQYTPGASAAAANFYAEGYLQVDTAPGNGYMYGVSGHPAIAASTAFPLYLTPDDPIQVALTAVSRVGLHANSYRQVVVSPTTATGLTVGGAVAVIPNNAAAENFGWLQTRGPFASLINGTPAIGAGLVISATTAGALDVAAVAAEINVRIVARAMQVGVSTKNNAVFLLLD